MMSYRLKKKIAFILTTCMISGNVYAMPAVLISNGQVVDEILETEQSLEQTTKPSLDIPMLLPLEDEDYADTPTILPLLPEDYDTPTVLPLLPEDNGQDTYKTRETEGFVINDPLLEGAIRRSLNMKDKTVPLTLSDMERVDTLDFQNHTGVSDLTGLEHCINLRVLDLSYGNITDLTPIANLTNLEEISLQRCNVNSLEPLRNLTELKKLDVINQNNVSDFSPIENLINLESLSIESKNVADFSFLAELDKVVSLDLAGSNITDDSTHYISNMSSLSVINLYELKGITNLDFLKSVSTLTEINATRSGLTNINGIANLPNLKKADFTQSNGLVEVPVLKNPSMEELNFSLCGSIKTFNNPTDLTNLKKLLLWKNQISDLSFITNMSSLIHLDCKMNHISDITPLFNLNNLNQVELSSNAIYEIDDVKQLKRLLPAATILINENPIDFDLHKDELLAIDPTIQRFYFVSNRHNALNNTSLNMIVSEEFLADQNYFGISSRGFNNNSPYSMFGILNGKFSKLANEFLFTNPHYMTFESLNPDVVSVDQTGKLKALKAGNATVKAYLLNRNDLSVMTYTFNIRVEAKEFNVKIKGLNEKDEILYEDTQKFTTLGKQTFTAKPVLDYIPQGQTEKTITIEKNTSDYEVVFRYAPIPKSTITIYGYHDSTGELLYEDVVADQPYGEYTAMAKELEGYEVKGNDIETITIDSANHDIYFYYDKVVDLTPVVPAEKIKGDINIKYIHQSTGNIIEEETLNREYGTHIVSAKTFEGYKLISDETQTVNLNSPLEEVVFYYNKVVDMTPIAPAEKLKGTIIIEGYDENNRLIYSERVEKEYGDHKIQGKEVEGYDFNGPKEKMVKLNSEQVTVRFDYLKKEDPKPDFGDIIVKGIHKSTGEIIHTQVINKEYGEHKIEAPTIKGYEVIGDNFKDITLDSPEIEIIFEYVKVIPATPIEPSIPEERPSKPEKPRPEKPNPKKEEVPMIPLEPAETVRKKITFIIGHDKWFINDVEQDTVMDALPTIKNNTFYVPIRYLSYSFGVSPADVYWMPQDGRQAFVKDGDIEIRTFEDTNIGIAYDTSFETLAPVYMDKADRIMLPVINTLETFKDRDPSIEYNHTRKSVDIWVNFIEK